MRFRSGSMLALAALAAGLAMASPAAAEDYDANCNPPSAEQQANLDAAQDMNLRIKALDRLVGNVCRMKQKLVRLFAIEPDPDKITNDMVMEAARPEIDPVKARMDAARDRNAAIERMKMRAERIERERRTSNPADEAVREANAKYEREHIPSPIPLTPAAAGERPPAPEPVVLPPTRSGGFITVFEGQQAPGTVTATTLTGEGTAITADGVQAGTFKDNQLQGAGEEVTADGTWRVGQFDKGEMEGEGFEAREEGGQIAVVEATFKDDKPDGVVEISYEDGTSRHDIWYKGQRAATGQLAAAGKVPVDPAFRTPEQQAADAAAKFEELLKTGDAQTLYTLGDQLLAKGATQTAKRAFQAIASRFPASPLAATAIAQLARQEATDRANAQQAEAARQAELARQAEAVRQAQLQQMQYQQQLEAQRQADEYARQQQAAADARRRQEESAAWGNFANALGQVVSGGRGGSATGATPGAPQSSPESRGCTRSSPEYGWTC